MNKKIVTILLIAAIILSVLSIVLNFSLDMTKNVSSKSVAEEKGADFGSVGLVVQETSINQNG